MYKELAEYETIFDKHLNEALINKSDDEQLLEFIIEAWQSLQIIEGIEILDWTYTDRMSEIDINKYIIKRNRNVRQKERFDFKYIEESYLGLLTVTVGLTVDVTDPKTNEVVTKKQTIKKSMLIPIMDEDGCYMLNGQRVYTIYQLVEKSTYTAANSVILKSLMPFAIRRYTHETKDTEGNPYVLPVYTIELFKKDVEVMLLFATRGLNHAIQFALEASYVCMQFVEQIDDPDDLSYIYFNISSRLFLKVDRSLFERFVYVRSVVGGILRICTNRLTIDKLDDCEIWLKKLGNNNLQKGENLLRSAKRLLDKTTGKILKVELYHKHDVYTLIRWACQEYNDLRMKDNMDLNSKRIRCGEIISSLVTEEFSFRLNRLMTFGKKADLNNYREVFSFPGDIIIQKMNSSGIIRYNDVINDMTFFSKTKYTIKGPHSLGNKNSNSISARYRGLHHSYIGHIDLTVCGNSDPGTSGVLSPYSKMDGLYFDGSPEPDDFMWLFHNAVKEVAKKRGITLITMDFDTKEDYYNALDDLQGFADDHVRITTTSRADDTSIVIEPTVDLDEKKAK